MKYVSDLKSMATDVVVKNYSGSTTSSSYSVEQKFYRGKWTIRGRERAVCKAPLIELLYVTLFFLSKSLFGSNT